MKPQTIVIAGGGTGGHVIPNIVIGKILGQRFPQVKIIHISGRRPTELHIFKAHHIKHHFTLKAQAFSGKGFFFKCFSLIQIALDSLTTLIWFLKWQPTLIIGVGGYASISAILAGKFLRKKIILHEQNAIPGLANKSLAKLAHHILLGMAEAKSLFEKNSSKCVFSGNFNIAKHPQFAGLSKRGHHGLRLLITGGSQGAKTLNEALITLMPEWLKQYPDLKIYWQCGEAWQTQLKSQLETYVQHKQIIVVGFEAILYEHYVEADVSITRAGALTIEDILSSACPAIIVPFPQSANNHQFHNAQTLVKIEGARLVEQHQADWKETLDRNTRELLEDQVLRQKMSKRLSALSEKNKANTVLTEIIQSTLKL
jgi:UDP-N-acetylglucosamine--N-acetylmuramyl-(pentapeptide) pyrophosphoryl-undecaprenol N-acetylglucosamine transferase